ncbi:MAG: hypothetical protein BGO14_03085 [Chlamydiales bacterium 38-26]|nr:hypothetical protein [Chlamydiales bacterium]OJV09324.1 MAG: hypothetical protein BGO14_03085 [Chlamydiales bacterium 38-26]
MSTFSTSFREFKDATSQEELSNFSTQNAKNNRINRTEKLFAKITKTVLPIFLLINAIVFTTNALKWDHYVVEFSSAVLMGFFLRLYAHYCSPKQFAKKVNEAVAGTAAESSFVIANVDLNLDSILAVLKIDSSHMSSAQTVLRVLTYFFTSYLVTHNGLTPTIEPPLLHAPNHRLCLDSHSNKYLLSTYYTSLIATGTFLLLRSYLNPAGSLDSYDIGRDFGYMVTSYAGVRAIGDVIIRSYDFMKRGKRRYEQQEITESYSNWKKNLKRFLDIGSNIVPPILSSINHEATYFSLGVVGAASQAYGERTFSRIDKQALLLEKTIQEGGYAVQNDTEESLMLEHSFNFKQTTLKAEHVKTIVWSGLLLAFTIACVLTNDWSVGIAMPILYAGYIGSYGLGRWVDRKVRKKDHPLTNRLAFVLSNPYFVNLIYNYFHTKFNLRDTDIKGDQGLLKVLAYLLYLALGVGMGNNRSEQTSLYNFDGARASSLGMNFWMTNSLEYLYLRRHIQQN